MAFYMKLQTCHCLVNANVGKCIPLYQYYIAIQLQSFPTEVMHFTQFKLATYQRLGS